MYSLVAEIELSDKNGNPKDLREHLHHYASEFLRDKEVYILLQVEGQCKIIYTLPTEIPWQCCNVFVLLFFLCIAFLS